ncbi:unnamed protein product, partial [Effrenium voratum]
SGGFLGAFVGRLLPAELTGGSGGSLCEIFGMVGLFASCFRFPLTPVVIVLEITGTESYNLILPVALSSFTALAVSNHLFPPLLEQLLEQDGIDLEAVAELAETADDEEFSQKASVELSDSQREEEDRPKRVDSVASVLHSATQTALGKLEMHLERSMLEVSSVDHTRRISLSSSRSPSSRRQSLGASFASAKNGLRRLSLRSESSTPRPGGLGDEMVGPCFASFASLWLQWRMGTGAPATALAAWRRAPRGHLGVDPLELGSHSVEGAFKGRVNFMTPDTAHWHFNGAGYGWRRFTGLRGTGKELSKTIRMCFSIFTGKTRLLPAILRRQQHE